MKNSVIGRRLFVGAGLAGAAASLVGTKAAVAAHKESMAGIAYYTKEQPGRWSKKIAGHLPNLKATTKDGKPMIEITTAHEMKAHEHYIVKHTLLDSEFNLVGEVMFEPTKDKAAISTFATGGKKGKFYGLSMCNKHDTWLATIEIS